MSDGGGIRIARLEDNIDLLQQYLDLMGSNLEPNETYSISVPELSHLKTLPRRLKLSISALDQTELSDYVDSKVSEIQRDEQTAAIRYTADKPYKEQEKRDRAHYKMWVTLKKDGTWLGE